MRSNTRKKHTGEVFTPTALVDTIINNLPKRVWSEYTNTFFDPACGNGQFLIAVAQRRKCLKNIFGVDLMVDNVCDTIARLHFFKLGHPDVFDHTGHSNCTTHTGHKDNIHPDYYWLLKNKKFTRTYTHNDCILAITIAREISNGIIFQCSDKDKDELYPTIVCANSLEFFKDGEKNGYDELTNEIKFFNDNNSDPIIPKITEPEITIPVHNVSSEAVPEVIIPAIKKVKSIPKKQVNQSSKLDQKIQGLEAELNKMMIIPNKHNSDLKIIELLKQQITEARGQL